MLGMTRWTSVDDFFTFQRPLESVFDQFWNELPGRTAAGQSPSFQGRHGKLQLTLPLKDSVKPRRIQIDSVPDQKQIASAA